MRFDAPTFARAWLQVANASAGNKLGILNKTMALEEYLYGIRLVAADGYVLLTAFVPNLDTYGGREPTFDTAPERTVVITDEDQRVAGLFRYVAKLERRDELDRMPDGTLELRVDFDVRIPVGAHDPQATLDGMEPTFAVLTLPDVEKVYAGVIEAPYPDWRPLILDHTPRKTTTVALAPERLGRLGKLWPGPIQWTFGGVKAPARLLVSESDPLVEGVVMPSRWLDLDEPQDDTPEPDEPPTGPKLDVDPVVEPELLRQAAEIALGAKGAAKPDPGVNVYRRELHIGHPKARTIYLRLITAGVLDTDGSVLADTVDEAYALLGVDE